MFVEPLSDVTFTMSLLLYLSQLRTHSIGPALCLKAVLLDSLLNRLQATDVVLLDQLIKPLCQEV
jgi:hypothetical protein